MGVVEEASAISQFSVYEIVSNWQAQSLGTTRSSSSVPDSPLSLSGLFAKDWQSLILRQMKTRRVVETNIVKHEVVLLDQWRDEFEYIKVNDGYDNGDLVIIRFIQVNRINSSATYSHSMVWGYLQMQCKTHIAKLPAQRSKESADSV